MTCGWCGVPRSDLTPGTTMIHADDAGIAGHRVLTACNDQHLTALRDHYRRRPFVHEELWMGRLTRAMNSPGGHAASASSTVQAAASASSGAKLDRSR